MKKFVIPFLVACFLMTSCDKSENIYVVNPVQTVYLDAYRNNWVPDPNTSYIYASFKMPEITNTIIQNGIVVAYYIDGQYDNMLPYLLPYLDQNTNLLYYENLRFDMRAGEITFIIEDSDFNRPNPPSHMKFKVSIVG